MQRAKYCSFSTRRRLARPIVPKAPSATRFVFGLKCASHRDGGKKSLFKMSWLSAGCVCAVGLNLSEYLSSSKHFEPDQPDAFQSMSYSKPRCLPSPFLSLIIQYALCRRRSANPTWRRQASRSASVMRARTGIESRGYLWGYEVRQAIQI